MLPLDSTMQRKAMWRAMASQFDQKALMLRPKF
jgi:hypothetical protein